MASRYHEQSDAPIGSRIAALLQAVRARIVELQQLLERIDAFETENLDELAGRADFRTQDPSASSETGETSPVAGYLAPWFATNSDDGRQGLGASTNARRERTTSMTADRQ
jgi:hypothetical protein